jgi:hypothetical protein
VKKTMKRHMKKLFKNTMPVLLLMVCAMAMAADTAPATPAGKTQARQGAGRLAVNTTSVPQAGKTETIRSVFVFPSNPKQGRDPFFPDSERPYEMSATANPQEGKISSLVLKGFSGPLNHRLVIINNHTFAAGDSGNILTPSGRIKLRCIEIKTNSVVIEVGSQRHELVFPKKFK